MLVVNELSISHIDFASQISSSSGGTNDGACKNYGYRTLTSNGAYVDIFSGGHNYGQNERCYWGIWAPGARILRFQLWKMDVRYILVNYTNLYVFSIAYYQSI